MRKHLNRILDQLGSVMQRLTNKLLRVQVEHFLMKVAATARTRPHSRAPVAPSVPVHLRPQHHLHPRCSWSRELFSIETIQRTSLTWTPCLQGNGSQKKLQRILRTSNLRCKVKLSRSVQPIHQSNINETICLLRDTYREQSA